MVHVFNFSTWEVEKCRWISWIEGQPDLHSVFQDIQGYTEKPCLKTNTGDHMILLVFWNFNACPPAHTTKLWESPRGLVWTTGFMSWSCDPTIAEHWPKWVLWLPFTSYWISRPLHVIHPLHGFFSLYCSVFIIPCRHLPYPVWHASSEASS